MDFDYKSIPVAPKLADLQDYYQTSVAFAKVLGVTRMTLIAWRDNPAKIKIKNQDKLDFLWCKYVFLPNIHR
ncbi:MAG: hypothetical protein HFP77_02470 [Methylococcales symbiont of Iophon sp. n. MRB-2018]|nr:MAG: hypothetical protein HFP77_02470 [Methylococcales symbiont of Iophon sp. n. MRB-2018]KAF3980411.1 MAG: hypothetical protein HFP76_02155 [Methylococcales symbiont of Iophon sp. n. MRB-2018]